ncbi:MAG: TolC family protein, partial [Candidatus Omnitrophota bacterium]
MEDYRELVGMVHGIHAMDMKARLIEREMEGLKQDRNAVERRQELTGREAGSLAAIGDRLKMAASELAGSESEIAGGKLELAELLGQKWVIGRWNPRDRTEIIFAGMGDLESEFSKGEGAAVLGHIVDTVIDDIVSGDPNMRLARERMEVDRLDVRGTKLERWNLSLDLFASLGISQNGTITSAGSNMSFTLWDWGKDKVKTRVAELKKEWGDLRVREESDRITREIDGLKKLITGLKTQSETAYKRWNDTRETADAARREYDAGETAYGAYMKKMQDAQKAEMALIDAVTQLNAHIGTFQTYLDRLDITPGTVEVPEAPVTVGTPALGNLLDLLIMEGKGMPALAARAAPAKAVLPAARAEREAVAVDIAGLKEMVRSNITGFLRVMDIKPAGENDLPGLEGYMYMTTNDWVDLWADYLSRKDLGGRPILSNEDAAAHMKAFIRIAGEQGLNEKLKGIDLPDWLGNYMRQQVTIKMAYDLDEEKPEIRGVMPDIFARMGYMNLLAHIGPSNAAEGRNPDDYILTHATAMDREHLESRQPVTLEDRIRADAGVMAGAEKDRPAFLVWQNAFQEVADMLETRTFDRALYGDKPEFRAMIEKYLGKPVTADPDATKPDDMYLAAAKYMAQNDLTYRDMEIMFAEISGRRGVTDLKDIADHLYGTLTEADVDRQPELFPMFKNMNDAVRETRAAIRALEAKKAPAPEERSELETRRGKLSELEHIRRINLDRFLYTAPLAKVVFVYNASLEFKAREKYIEELRKALRQRGHDLGAEDVVRVYGYDETAVYEIKRNLTPEEKHAAISAIMNRYNDPDVIRVISAQLGVNLDDRKVSPGYVLGDKVVTALLHSVIENKVDARGAVSVDTGRLPVREVKTVRRYIKGATFNEDGDNTKTHYILLGPDGRQIAMYTQEAGTNEIFVSTGSRIRPHAKWKGEIKFTREGVPYIDGYKSESFRYEKLRTRVTAVVPSKGTEDRRSGKKSLVFPAGTILMKGTMYSRPDDISGEKPGEESGRSFFYYGPKGSGRMIGFSQIIAAPGSVPVPGEVVETWVTYFDSRGTTEGFIGEIDLSADEEQIGIRSSLKGIGRPVLKEHIEHAYRDDVRTARRVETEVKGEKYDIFSGRLIENKRARNDKDGNLLTQETLDYAATGAYGQIVFTERDASGLVRKYAFRTQPGETLDYYIAEREKCERGLDECIDNLTKRGIAPISEGSYRLVEGQDKNGDPKTYWDMVTYRNFETDEQTIDPTEYTYGIKLPDGREAVKVTYRGISSDEMSNREVKGEYYMLARGREILWETSRADYILPEEEAVIRAAEEAAGRGVAAPLLPMAALPGAYSGSVQEKEAIADGKKKVATGYSDGKFSYTQVDDGRA